jgi:hypothetical protein
VKAGNGLADYPWNWLEFIVLPHLQAGIFGLAFDPQAFFSSNLPFAIFSRFWSRLVSSLWGDE